MTLQVQGFSRAWAVYDGQERISGYFGNHSLAADCMANKERRANIKIRPCMCCQANFESEGAHNRMCDKCRRKDGGMW